MRNRLGLVVIDGIPHHHKSHTSCVNLVSNDDEVEVIEVKKGIEHVPLHRIVELPAPKTVKPPTIQASPSSSSNKPSRNKAMYEASHKLRKPSPLAPTLSTRYTVPPVVNKSAPAVVRLAHKPKPDFAVTCSITTTTPLGKARGDPAFISAHESSFTRGDLYNAYLRSRARPTRIPHTCS